MSEPHQRWFSSKKVDSTRFMVTVGRRCVGERGKETTKKKDNKLLTSEGVDGSTVFTNRKISHAIRNSRSSSSCHFEWQQDGKMTVGLTTVDVFVSQQKKNLCSINELVVSLHIHPIIISPLLLTWTMATRAAAARIQYSDKYEDGDYEYRCVSFPTIHLFFSPLPIFLCIFSTDTTYKSHR